jgi:enoyl-CoA hydratase/carnithine racemase
MRGTKARMAGCREFFKGEMMAELNTGQTDLIGRIEGNVAILSFNRPEVRNALSRVCTQVLKLRCHRSQRTPVCTS